jgi:hypothetical protein
MMEHREQREAAMFTNRATLRRLKSMAALAAAALAVAGWLLAQGDGLRQVLAAALVACLAVAGVLVWDFQQRAWDRWQDAVDAYADEEIKRAKLALRQRTRRSGQGGGAAGPAGFVGPVGYARR